MAAPTKELRQGDLKRQGSFPFFLRAKPRPCLIKSWKLLRLYHEVPFVILIRFPFRLSSKYFCLTAHPTLDGCSAGLVGQATSCTMDFNSGVDWRGRFPPGTASGTTSTPSPPFSSNSSLYRQWRAQSEADEPVGLPKVGETTTRQSSGLRHSTKSRHCLDSQWGTTLIEPESHPSCLTVLLISSGLISMCTTA